MTEMPTALFLCSRAYHKDGHIAICFKRVLADGLGLGPESTFGYKPRWNHVKPGAVWAIPFEEKDEHLMLGLVRAKFERPWMPEDEATAMRATLTAAEVERTVYKRMGETDATLKSMRVLDPLRRFYQATNAQGKLALEVVVLSYLRRPL